MGTVQASTRKTHDPKLVNQNDFVAYKGPGNPGSFEDIHKKTKDLYPQNFEGARLNINKILSEHFTATHSIILSSVIPSGYKFATKYVGTKIVNFTEKYPVIIGEISANGNLTASFVHTLGCRLRYKLSAQIANERWQNTSSSLEYRGNDYTVAITLENLKILKQQGIVVIHFLQAITSRIALGAEIACLRGSIVPGGLQTVMCMAFRYSTGYVTLSGTIGEAGLHLCYYRKASSQLQIGTELETNLRTNHSTGSIMYQVDLPHANLIFRGIVNSEATFGAVFEKKLYPIPECSLIISGLLNHRRQKFRVGIGLNIGQ